LGRARAPRRRPGREAGQGGALTRGARGPRQVRLDTARAKAEAVIGQPDLTERGKAREVEKLYARARAGKGAKKAKPTRAQREHGGMKGPRLDARLRADQRQARGPLPPPPSGLPCRAPARAHAAARRTCAAYGRARSEQPAVTRFLFTSARPPAVAAGRGCCACGPLWLLRLMIPATANLTRAVPGECPLCRSSTPVSTPLSLAPETRLCGPGVLRAMYVTHHVQQPVSDR